LGSGEGGQSCKVGLVARWEEEGSGVAKEVGETSFEVAVFGVVTRDEAGRTGSEARAGGREGSGSGEGGVAGEAKVVVAREREDRGIS
jgi:hypothetical protein